MGKKSKVDNSLMNKKPDWSIFVALAIVAAFIRVIITIYVPGYSTDIGCFTSWTNTVISKGMHNFYQAAGFADYPPGYIYVLYFMGLIPYFLKLSGQALEFFIKLPPMLTDILTAVIVYKMAIEKLENKNLALMCAAAMMFNPLMVVNSAAWGQVDSVFALVLVLAIYFMTEKKLVWGAFIYGLAILIKPQALILGPAVLAIYINYWDFKKFSQAIGVGIVTIIGFAVPFSFSQKSPFWLIELYYKTMFEQYKYTSLNAPNLYGAMGKNALPLETPFLGLDYAMWGNILMVVGVLSVFLFFFLFAKKGGEPRNYIYMLSAYTLFIMFMVGTKMHERYIFPVMLFMLFDYFESRDLKSLYLSIGVGIVNAVCVAVLLSKSYSKVFYYAPNELLFIIMSWLNIMMIAVLLYQIISRLTGVNIKKLLGAARAKTGGNTK